jgi:GPH family glycoside/pentoside/hexuronide:cation symporter
MKLSKRIKLLYGFGFSAQGIKDGLFQIFLFFYFSQVLGLSAGLTGMATIIALLFDAISDPLVGVLSDRWKSKKWGRRHGFMLISAIPLGAFIYLLFLPPSDLDQTGLFLWLTIFTILVRVSLTLFQVPSMSLGAELSADYNERTSITSYRVMFAALMSTLIIIVGFVVFFVPSEKYSRGLMNPETYPKFAMFCGFLIILSVIVSTLGTKRVILSLPKAAKNQVKFNLKTFFKEVAMMFRMKSYRTIILYTMVLYIGIGVGTVFTTYFMEYYFQFTETQMALLPIASGIGGILALFLASILGEKFDKKRAVLYSTIAFSILFSLPYNLRLLGIFPENGELSLILIYFVCILFAYMFLWIVLSIVGSMMADVVDEFELKTNNRNEGLFFSSMSFAYKCTVGLGYFIAGVLLEIIAFPKQVGIEDIPTKAIEGLGFIGGPVLMSTYLLAIIFLITYPINKKRYNEIRVALENKK